MPSSAPAKGKRLRVRIGPNREALEVAYVNHPERPTEIDTEWFVGRIVVRVLDFTGVTPDGSAPAQDDLYFEGRQRRFAIHIEGRFKKTGELYTGDEIEFGTDFDHQIAFPRTLFNAGMRIARMVDSSVHFDEHATRPFIMSPYAACMNTIAAWPAPNRVADAVVCLRRTELEEDGEHTPAPKDEAADDFVPEDVLDSLELSGKKPTRHTHKYWRFIGFRGDPKVDAWLSSRRPDLIKKHSIGNLMTEQEDNTSVLGAAKLSAGEKEPVPPSGKSFGFGALRKALQRAESEQLVARSEDFSLASKVSTPASRNGEVSAIEKQLGPWRFGRPGYDLIEDNTCINGRFKPYPTARRRKHFSDKATREAFKYDPDVVYGTSFFTPFCDLNTLDLKMGSMLNLNLQKYLAGMPIRYTLRSTRMGPALRSGGEPEPITFATIEFQLVDV